MWQTVDYKGNTVKWYEENLINKIKAECNECYQNNVKYYGLALNILELIQENEECMHQ